MQRHLPISGQAIGEQFPRRRRHSTRRRPAATNRLRMQNASDPGACHGRSATPPHWCPACPRLCRTPHAEECALPAHQAQPDPPQLLPWSCSRAGIQDVPGQRQLFASPVRQCCPARARQLPRQRLPRLPPSSEPTRGSKLTGARNSMRVSRTRRACGQRVASTDAGFNAPLLLAHPPFAMGAVCAGW